MDIIEALRELNVDFFVKHTNGQEIICLFNGYRFVEENNTLFLFREYEKAYPFCKNTRIDLIQHIIECIENNTLDDDYCYLKIYRCPICGKLVGTKNKVVDLYNRNKDIAYICTSCMNHNNDTEIYKHTGGCLSEPHDKSMVEDIRIYESIKKQIEL